MMLDIPEWGYDYWFHVAPENDGTWIVSYIRSGDFLCNFSEETGLSIDEPELTVAFEDFKHRPEYKLAQYAREGISLPDVITVDQVDILSQQYNECLAGAMLLRYVKLYKDANIGIKRIQTMLNWLNGNKFYTGPASSRFHESFSGGLLYHSIKVFNQMIKLRQLDCFKYQTDESLALIALTHDWCKIGLYESYLKNVKNEETGKWEQREAYRRELKGIPMGHGSTSVYYIQKFVTLTDEEALAIRWHMGLYYCHEAEMDDLQKSNETYPLVHMLQFADQLAITNYVN